MQASQHQDLQRIVGVQKLNLPRRLLTRQLLGAAILCMAVTGVHAQEKGSTSTLGLHAGTLGIGASYSFHPTATLAIRAVLNQGGYRYNRIESGNQYEAELSFGSLGGLLDWYMFGGSIRLSVGGFINNNALDFESESDEIYLSKNSYLGSIRFSSSTEEFAPYVGIGFQEGGARRQAGVSYDIGILLQGPPILTATGTVGSCGFDVDHSGTVGLVGTCDNYSNLRMDIADEYADFKDKINEFSLYPVLVASVTLSF